MLSRASSDAGTRLRRSKSASTVPKRPIPISEPLDRDVAQQHAVAAAMAAFNRAQVHDAAEREAKRSSDMSRSKSNASRKSLTGQGQGSHFPPRESSFRSMQQQKTGQSSNSQRLSRGPTANTEQSPPFYPTPRVERPASAPRPLSTQPSVAFSDNSHPSTQPRASRLSGTPSITSQQLRKARSVYYASSVQTGSPIARPPVKYLTTPPLPLPPKQQASTPSVPESRPSVPSPLASPRIPVTVTTNETVEQARDKYLQNFQQRSVKQKPSMFLAPFKKRQEKTKDKGKRKASNGSAGAQSSHQTPHDSSADVTLNDFLPQPTKTEKRSFSDSLKSKFKRVFRRTSKESTYLPVQQIEASRDYFGPCTYSEHDTHLQDNVPSPDDNLLQRSRSRTPSLEYGMPSLLRAPSRSSSKGSGRSNRSQSSLHSERNLWQPASRVTTWATSATSETLAQRAIKRLTVIHESKDSIGSEVDRLAFMPMGRKPLPLGTLAAFRDPMPMDSLVEESSTPVDPKHVFSALMKEINTARSMETMSDPADHTPGAESDVFESSKTKELHSSSSKDCHPSITIECRPPYRRPPSVAAQSVQSKTSSIRSLGRAIRSTIRTVTPGELRSSPCPMGAHGETEMPPIPQSFMSPSPMDELPILDDVQAIRTQDPCTTQAFSPSALQIEKRVEKAKERWKTPLDDVENLQFPRETQRTYHLVTDDVPYKSRFDPHDPPETTRATPMPQLLPSRRFVPHGSPVILTPQRLMSPLSPSVYSRNTDGMSILPNDSDLSLEQPNGAENSHDNGSAVIIHSKSVRKFVVGTPSPRRSGSGRTSRDWKAWLSHEVSSMASVSHEELKIDESLLTPSKRDITRSSHTDHDDTTVILHDSCEVSNSRLEAGNPAIITNGRATADAGTAFLEKSSSHPDTFKEVSPANTPTSEDGPDSGGPPLRPSPIPVLSKKRPSFTSSNKSMSSRTAIDTPRSARMNDRFPYIQSARRLSNNSSGSFRKSKSPTESIASSLKSAKGTPSPRIYSDLHAPATAETSHRVPATAKKVSDQSQYTAKENVTPNTNQLKMMCNTTAKTPSTPDTRTKSLQPLSSATLNRTDSNVIQYTSNAPDTKHAKHNSSPAATPNRPRIRAIVRPISPEKFTRRPRSAFDLRNSTNHQPRPMSELRRPALVLKSSSSLFEPSEERISETRDQVLDTHANDGEKTPGQRLAESFLRERKSASVLVRDGARQRPGQKLTREDTPAFL